MPPRELGNVIAWDHRVVREGFVERADHLVKNGLDVRLYLELVMVAAILLGDLSGDGPFVEKPLAARAKTDRERT